jgi:hypothetical protein
MLAQAVATLVGLWLMAAPDVLSFAGPARLSHVIVGPLVATVGLTALWEATRDFRYANLPFGLWLLAAPAVLHPQSSEAMASHLASGGLVVVASLVRGRVKGTYGGGWVSLLADPRDEGRNRAPAANGPQP